MVKISEKNNQLKINELLDGFCSEYFDSDLKSYSLNLFEKIKKKSPLNIDRGSSEIWAASIIYVIARLNFLFDKSSENYISVDELCGYFNVKKSTIGNKASQVEKVYKIKIGDRKYTKPEIAKSFEYYMTPEGFMIPASSGLARGMIIEAAEGEELEELLRNEDELKRKREEELQKSKERKAEINRKIREEKIKKRNRDQMNLFDS